MTTPQHQNKEENLFTILVNRFLPFWPLFVILGGLFLALAWAYLSIATPSYQVTASLIIKDQMKGVNDPRITESINSFDSNKIVENEIEVIKSRDLMREVVNELGLYAPVYEEKGLKDVPAYLLSSVKLELKDPEAIVTGPASDTEYSLAFDEKSGKVTFAGKSYTLNKWVETPVGLARFVKNKNFKLKPERQQFIRLVHPKVVTNDLVNQLKVNAASKDATVINLELTDKVPARGEDILNTLIVAYNQSAANVKNKLAANTLDFIENRIQEVEQELGDLEARIQQYKTANGIVDLSEQGKVYLQSVGENDRKVSEINLQLAVLDKVERYVAMQDSSSSIVPATLGVSDPVLIELLKRLQDTESEYQRLKRTTAENNPALSALASDIGRTRRNITENIQSQRVNLLASRADLSSTKSKYMAALQRIPIQERELLEISRQQATKRDVYNLLLEKREETALSYTPVSLDTRVVNFAEASVYPAGPRPMLVYVAALMLAFLAGVCWIIGKEFLNRKVMFRSEIEDNTSAPVVAEISRLREKITTPFKAPADPVIIEQFRQLRVSLGLYGKTISKQKILVTSSIPGEGKTFVSVQLAATLAASGKKVALLDLDLRKPGVTALFDMAGISGISDYLLDEAESTEIIRASSVANLSVVPAGSAIGDHTDLLLNGAMDTLIAKLEKAFDYLIIDTPPLDLVTDGYLLSEYCDISLLVIRHNYTPKAIVRELEESNKQKALHNLAIVFNGVKSRGFFKGKFGLGYGKDNRQIFKSAYKRSFMKSSA